MEQVVLEARARKERGKIQSNRLRKSGYVPGVIYGRSMEALSIQIQDKEMRKVLAKGGSHKLINVKINGNDSPLLCLIQEVQKDPIQKEILHVDLHQISMDETISVTVPVHLKGEAPGVSEGGVLDHVLWEMEVEALPTQLPESVTVDISQLTIGHPIHVKEVPLPEGVKTLEEPEAVVVVVHPPRVEVVEAPAVEALAAAAPAPTQPEVITKGKEKEGEEA